MPQSTLSSWFKKPSTSETLPQSHSGVKLTETSNPPPLTPSARLPPPNTQPTNHDRNAQDTKPQDANTNTKQLPSSSSKPAAQQSTTSFLRALQPSLSPLPAPISFAPMTEASMPAFQRLNALLLPIPYKRDFYDEILSDPVSNAITLLAFWDPSVTTSTRAPSSPNPTHNNPQEAETEAYTHTPSGTPFLPSPPPRATLTAALRCRIYPHPLSPPSPSVSSSAPDPPVLYISTLVLLPSYRYYGIATHLLATITARAVQRYGVTAVTAHVWEANEEGRAWYRARGFVEEGRVEGYYARLRPSGAVVVRRGVGVGEWAAAAGGGGEGGVM